MQWIQKTDVAWFQDFLTISKKKRVRNGSWDKKHKPYLSCSVGATESNPRLGERRMLRLRVCSSFICWCRMASLKESMEEVIIDVGTICWVFETFKCSRWNRIWVISKRCSIKICEGKSIRWRDWGWALGMEHTGCFHEPCPIFLCDCKSIAIIRASSREIQCESHSLTASKVDLLVVVENIWKTGIKRGTHSLSSSWEESKAGIGSCCPCTSSSDCTSSDKVLSHITQIWTSWAYRRQLTKKTQDESNTWWIIGSHSQAPFALQFSIHSVKNKLNVGSNILKTPLNDNVWTSFPSKSRSSDCNALPSLLSRSFVVEVIAKIW